MHVAGKLRYLSMRQRARWVKLMLDWVVHGRRMQLMGVNSSGQFPICMEKDSLEHMIFACRYSMAIQKRQTWSDGIRIIIAGNTPRTGRGSSGKADRHLYRHPERILLWRTIWPASICETLAQGCGASVPPNVGSRPGLLIPRSHGAPVYKTGLRGTCGNQRMAP